jgi:hypothetical protein
MRLGRERGASSELPLAPPTNVEDPTDPIGEGGLHKWILPRESVAVSGRLAARDRNVLD